MNAIKFWWHNGGPSELVVLLAGSVGFAAGMWAIGVALGVA